MSAAAPRHGLPFPKRINQFSVTTPCRSPRFCESLFQSPIDREAGTMMSPFSFWDGSLSIDQFRGWAWVARCFLPQASVASTSPNRLADMAYSSRRRMIRFRAGTNALARYRLTTHPSNSCSCFPASHGLRIWTGRYDAGASVCDTLTRKCAFLSPLIRTPGSRLIPGGRAAAWSPGSCGRSIDTLHNSGNACVTRGAGR